MAKFNSSIPNLTLQDGDVTDAKGKVTSPAPWAVFADGEFETSDQAVIERLASVAGVSQLADGTAVPSAPPAAPEQPVDPAQPTA